MTAAQDAALVVARQLIRAGVPVFVAPPDPTKPLGYRLPDRWQTSRPLEDVLDRWQPGWALCAVMGHTLDLLDVDPRNGGDQTRQGLIDAGMWPRVYARAETPSGGTHEFVARLRVRSLDNVRPGLDVKAGLDDGEGRGFAFIAPTERASKVTGEFRSYTWTALDLDALGEGDDTGEDIAALVRQRRTPAAKATGDEDGPRHSGPVTVGGRDEAFISYAGRLRARGLSIAEAKHLMRRRWEDAEQPAGDRFPLADALAKVDRAFDKYQPVLDVDDDGHVVRIDESPAAVAPELRTAELAADPKLLEAVTELMRRDRARQIVTELSQPNPQPVDAGTLAELLARDEPDDWRVDGLLPAGGRLLLAAIRKAGKTTTIGNLSRALLTGEPFLGRFDVAKLDGRVVVLNYEVSGTQFARWMDDIGVPSNRLYAINLRGRRNLLATDEGRAELVEMIRAQEGEALIVDPFGRAYTGRSQNDSAEVTPWLVRLDELAERAGSREVILTAHAGWEGERTRGSSALEDWPDSIVTVTWDRENDQRFIRAEGRDVYLDEDRLDYDPATRTLTLSGAGNRKQVRQSQRVERLAEAVRAVVAGEPGINVNGIRAALRDRDEHLQRDDANAACRLAVERGWVRREPGPRNSWKHFPASVVPSSPEQSPGQVVSGPDPSYKDGTTRAHSAARVVPDGQRAIRLIESELGGVVVEVAS